jgi:hypothetical protein
VTRVQINNTGRYWRNCPSGIEITPEDYPLGDAGQYLFIDLGQIKRIFESGLSEWSPWVIADLRKMLEENDA